MSVAATIPVTQRRGLVQVLSTDPSTFLKWSGDAVADGTGGTLSGTCNVPADLACMWIGITCFFVSAYAGDAFYSLREDDTPVFDEIARNSATVGTAVVFPCYEPPHILWTADAIAAQAFGDNVDGDDMTVKAFAFGWDKQHARNLPQRFMWPGMLS